MNDETQTLTTQTWNGRCPKCLGPMELMRTFGIYRERRCLDKDCGEVVSSRESPISGLEFRSVRAGRSRERRKGE